MDDEYMMGDCHLYAVALHRVFGHGLAAVVGKYRGELAIYHVFALREDGTALDIRGEHKLDDLVDEQEAMDGSLTWIVPLAGEGAVRSLCAADLLHPMVEYSIERAMDVVGTRYDVDVDYEEMGADAGTSDETMPDLSEEAALDLRSPFPKAGS